ncbi:MAG: hypothetical protein HY925_13025 [Elusimicrobia bacterium]|nr:hypothetical protein [Elusimicrobiota bacterium]
MRLLVIALALAGCAPKSDVRRWYAEGIEAQRAGRSAEARASFERVLATDAGAEGVHNSLAVLDLEGREGLERFDSSRVVGRELLGRVRGGGQQPVGVGDAPGLGRAAPGVEIRLPAVARNGARGGGHDEKERLSIHEAP